MADKWKDEAGGSLGGQDRRDGFGDDQGTRIGRPDPQAPRGASARSGPSSQPVKEGLEGAIFEDDDGNPEEQRSRSNTGAGAEAAEGVHSASSGKHDASTRSSSSSQRDRQGNPEESPGSQPIRGRTHEHKGGYGGEGGEPRGA